MLFSSQTVRCGEEDHSSVGVEGTSGYFLWSFASRQELGHPDEEHHWEGLCSAPIELNVTSPTGTILL